MRDILYGDYIIDLNGMSLKISHTTWQARELINSLRQHLVSFNRYSVLCLVAVNIGQVAWLICPGNFLYDNDIGYYSYK